MKEAENETEVVDIVDVGKTNPKFAPPVVKVKRGGKISWRNSTEHAAVLGFLGGTKKVFEGEPVELPVPPKHENGGKSRELTVKQDATLGPYTYVGLLQPSGATAFAIEGHSHPIFIVI